MDISAAVQGLAQGLNGYLQTAQNDKREQQKYVFQKQVDLQEQSALDAQKQQNDLASKGQVTPEMADSLIPGSSKWVQLFKQQNGRFPTTDEAKTGLTDVVDKLNGNKDKPVIKHYLGNDPSGNAIFADNQGNMFAPDGSKYTGTVLPKSSTMPTSQTRSSAEFAKTILPHITEMRGLINQAADAGYIGPTAGRVYNQFMAGTVGSTGDDNADRLLGRLRAMDSLMKTGTMKAHFGSRGGQQMYEHFSEMLNTGKQSKEILNGTLDTLESFMKGYAEAGQPQGGGSPEPAANNDPLGILK